MKGITNVRQNKELRKNDTLRSSSGCILPFPELRHESPAACMLCSRCLKKRRGQPYRPSRRTCSARFSRMHG